MKNIIFLYCYFELIFSLAFMLYLNWLLVLKKMSFFFLEFGRIKIFFNQVPNGSSIGLGKIGGHKASKQQQ